jgi:hypothetical protein
MKHTLERLRSPAGRKGVGVLQDAAELIRRAGGYRWVGVYEVTDTEIASAVQQKKELEAVS